MESMYYIGLDVHRATLQGSSLLTSHAQLAGRGRRIRFGVHLIGP